MSDIVERLRREVAWEQDVGELLEEAAAEIARLRLTDAEREAVEAAANGYELDGDDDECASTAATLRGLLERLGGGV
jgi:hypothetical protein